MKLEESGNILSGDIYRLRNYRELVLEYTGAEESYQTALLDEKKVEKELAQQKKELKELKESTVKKRLAEVTDKYDQEILKEENRLKKMVTKRGKAKEKGVKLRIEEETLELVDQNKELKRNIKASLKSEHLPSICKRDLYYILYFTNGIVEATMFALIVILMLLVFPVTVYAFLPLNEYPEIPAFAVTYFTLVILIYLIYKFIGDHTKKKHEPTLRAVRQMKDQIAGNKKQIRNISKSIKKDKSDAAYELDDYDLNITKLKDKIVKIRADKEEAIKNFNDKTQNEIIMEIEKKESPQINKTENKSAQIKVQREALAEKEQQIGLKISTDYIAYIGKEFSEVSKIDELLKIMETGKAKVVSEAIDIFKSEV